MRVAVFSAKSYDREYLRSASQSADLDLRFFATHLNDDTVAIVRKFDAVCCFASDNLNAKVIKKLAKHGVKLIALRCAGYNNVDLDAAKEAGISVCCAPEYSAHTIAEHAVALILDLNRNIHRAFNRVRENNYSLSGLQGFDLHGKTVGILGVGAIGLAFAKVMKGFGCEIIATDPVETATFSALGRYVDQDTLWRSSDIISLHCPLIPPTYHVINLESITRMRKGVMLINTSRSGLIDIDAIIDSLKSGHIGYLGLDVYEEEAGFNFEDDTQNIVADEVFTRLMTFPNVVVTGHQAYFTHEALQRIARVTIDNIVAFGKGSLNYSHQLV
jgi:D-lactate dehydrogenase